MHNGRGAHFYFNRWVSKYDSALRSVSSNNNGGDSGENRPYKNVHPAQIHVLFEIDSLHAIHIIPIDCTTESSLSSAVQFVILSIIACG